MIYAATPFEPSIHCDTGAGEPGPLLRWRFPEPARAVASGMLGGGLSTASWVINAQVRADYGRMDPEKHLREIALEQGLDPDAGVGLMTAARVERVATAIDGPDGAEVRCDATVGVSYPTWASAPDDDPLPDKPWRPGTINIVCQLPVPLTDAALVGAVITATEAKAQALIEAGMPGTGTASDAIVICCP
ncbi:MAG: adenosylcobinamide amidohydrolase, partial [Nakamurella sp.]